RTTEIVWRPLVDNGLLGALGTLRGALPGRHRLAIEPDVDGHPAEAGDLQRDGEVLADRVLGGRAGEAEQDRIGGLLHRLLLGKAGILPGQVVLRVAGDPDAFAQVLGPAFI